jgi:hypothetical protein
MSENKTKKIPVLDLKPSGDAKGGRHGHRGSQNHIGAGRASGGSGTDSSERAGKYWL